MRTIVDLLFASVLAMTASACAANPNSADAIGRSHETTESVTSASAFSTSVDVVPTTAEVVARPNQPANCSDLAVGPVSLSDPRFERVTEISNQLKAYGVSGFYVGAGASCDVSVTAGDLPPDIVEWLRSLQPTITLELGHEVRPL